MKKNYLALAAAIVATTMSAQASLIQWLTATNVSTLETNGSGTVTNWLDSSGSANDTANAGDIIGTPLYPSTILSASGLPGVDMGAARNGLRIWSTNAQDAWLDFTGAASGKSGFAVLVAFKANAILGGIIRDTLLANRGDINGGFGLKYEQGTPRVFIGGTQYINNDANAKVAAGDTVVFAFNYDKATGNFELWESKAGTSLTGTKAAADFSNIVDMYLGTTPNSGQYMNGEIFEVRVYDGYLTPTELNTYRAQMTNQWVTPPATPLAPAWVSAQPDDSAVHLTWLGNNAAGVLSNFFVFRSLTSGSSYTPIATNATTSYTDLLVTNGTTYYYVLKAVGTNGVVSDFSTEKAVTPIVISTNVVLVQYLDADVSGSVSNVSGQVVTWLDQTANANDGTPLFATNGVGTPLFPSSSLSGSGKAGVDLGANSWPALSSTNRSGIDLFTVAQQTNWLDFTGGAVTNGGFSALVAFKADSIGTGNARNTVLVNHGNPSTTNTFGLRFDAAGTMEAFLGGTTYQKTSAPKVNVGDTIVYAFTYDERTGVIQFWDSKSQVSLLATNVAFGNFASSQNLRLGTSDNNQQRFDGMIGEVKIYAGKLDSTALITEGESLATKWGASTPAISTNAVLIQHLDADVPDSLITFDGQVLTWLDQSDNANNADPTTGVGAGTPLYPSASLSGSGKVGVDLGTNSWPVVATTNRSGMDLFAVASQASWLDFGGAAISNGGFSALVAFKADSVITNDAVRNPVLVNHGNAAIANSFGLRINGSGFMEAFLGGQNYVKANNAPVKDGDTIVYGFNYDELTGVIEFWDSKNNSSLIATNTPFGNFASTQKLRLGTSDNNGQAFDGMVGEVKIYAGKLSSAAMIAEGQSLATKWGAVVAKTNDFYLSNLVLSSGTLSPTFGSNVLSYTASVPSSVSNLTVTPTAASANSVISVQVNGGGYANVASGSPSGLLDLNVGANTVDVLVTAENQAFTRTYTVTVTRAAGGPTPEPLTPKVSGGNLILSWTDPSWKLATGTKVTAITNIVPGATSPYTNNLSEPQRYFRLVYP